MVIPITYTTIWSNGTVETKGTYDTETKEVVCDSVDGDWCEGLEQEYITLPDGTEIDRYENEEEEIENFFV